MELTVEEIKILKFVAKRNKTDYDKHISLQKFKKGMEIYFIQDYEDNLYNSIKKDTIGIIKNIFTEEEDNITYYEIDFINDKLNDRYDLVVLNADDIINYVGIKNLIKIKATSFTKIKLGDSIKISYINKFDICRDNDAPRLKVREIFTDNISHVVEIAKEYIIVACYSGQDYPNDNFYVIKLYSGEFVVKNHCKNTYRGAIYYKEDFFGYANEDEMFVYLVHYYVYQNGIKAMRKVKKSEYYQYAISINEFDYAKQHYNPEWDLVGKELK